MIWVVYENVIDERLIQDDIKLISGVIRTNSFLNINCIKHPVPICGEILCEEVFFVENRLLCSETQNHIFENIRLSESFLF